MKRKIDKAKDLSLSREFKLNSDIHLRLDTELNTKMHQAMESLNTGGYLNVSAANFIRMSINTFSNQCLNGQAAFSLIVKSDDKNDNSIKKETGQRFK